MSVPSTLFYYYQLAISAPLNTSIKEVMFILVQMKDSNLTIIMYNARKDQFNVYWWGQEKLSKKAQEQ